MALLVDMNLSPDWVPFLRAAGYQAVHWSSVGDPKAKDHELMAWAIANRHMVFTHDLDFGTVLALTHGTGPSVLQVRTQDLLPKHLGPIVLSVLSRYDHELSAGALIVVDEQRSRVRILPI
ncbi:hypothetical protein GC163_09420 [bacterium]|nr:hypothetical protein [bacterium]